ncbi:MAG: lipid-A-disaccharide synthase N-terminal domain-containing protein [Phycisphaerales bacterium]
MKPTPLIAMLLLVVIGVALLFMILEPGSERVEPDNPDRITLDFPVPGNESQLILERNPDGSFSWILNRDTHHEISLTPDDFAEHVFNQSHTTHWWQAIFNIATPFGLIWVTIGLVGQILFTGRMVLQWLVSEKAKRSVVPPAFWWMSLTGATMLLVYFIWRRDLVGVLGQATGWLIYTRNLWLIYKKPGDGGG